MKIEDEIKSKFRNDYHKAVVNLLYTNNAVSNVLNNRFKLFGLAPPQFNVLRILKGQNKAASIGLIKDRMLDKNSDVSRIVDRLFKKGLVERKESAADRRQKDVLISDKGLTLLDEINEFEKTQKQVTTNLSLEEVKTLNDLLDKVRVGL